MPIRGDSHAARALALFACLILVLLPAGGLTVCLGAHHLAVGAVSESACPCGDHGDDLPGPCVDITLVPPDASVDDGVLPSPVLPSVGAPQPYPIAVAPVIARAAPRAPPPAPDIGIRLRRSVVLVI